MTAPVPPPYVFFHDWKPNGSAPQQRRPSWLRRWFKRTTVVCLVLTSLSAAGHQGSQCATQHHPTSQRQHHHG